MTMYHDELTEGQQAVLHMYRLFSPLQQHAIQYFIATKDVKTSLPEGVQLFADLINMRDFIDAGCPDDWTPEDDRKD